MLLFVFDCGIICEGDDQMNNQMYTRSSVAWNTHLISFVLLFFVFVFLSMLSFVLNDLSVGISFVLLTFLTVFLFLTSPQYIVFSDEWVEIVYCFRLRRRICWCDVVNIYKVDRARGPSHYVIVSPEKEKQPFFVKKQIPKTRRTTELLNRFYGRGID